MKLGKNNPRQRISPKTLHKTLSWLDDVFTYKDLKEKMDERNVFGEVNEDRVRSRIRRMKKIGAVKIKGKGIDRETGKSITLYEKADNYK